MDAFASSSIEFLAQKLDQNGFLTRQVQLIGKLLTEGKGENFNEYSVVLATGKVMVFTFAYDQFLHMSPEDGLISISLEGSFEQMPYA